jgi:hypothetical protein
MECRGISVSFSWASKFMELAIIVKFQQFAGSLSLTWHLFIIIFLFFSSFSFAFSPFPGVGHYTKGLVWNAHIGSA